MNTLLVAVTPNRKRTRTAASVLSARMKVRAVLSKKESKMALLIRILFRPKVMPRRVIEVFSWCDAEFDKLDQHLEQMASKGAP